MEETLDLRRFFEILKLRILLILTVVALMVGIATAISYYMLTPVYESSTQILVNQEKVENANIASENVERDLRLINTYRVIISSPTILQQVNEMLNLNVSLQEMNEKVTVTSTSESQVIDISVRDEDPEMAAEIANTIANVFEKEIQEVMNLNNTTILFEATATDSQSPVWPNLWLNLAITAALGLLLGIGMAILLDYLDTSVKNQQDVKRLLDVPVLAVISPIDPSDKTQEKSELALNEKEA